MNLDAVATVLRERSSLEVVDLAFRFIRSLRPLLTIQLMAFTLLPLLGGAIALRYVMEVDWPIIWALLIAVSWIAELPFLALAGELLVNPNTSLRQVLKTTKDRAIPFLVSWILQSLLLLLVMPTVVGPLFVASTICFANEAVVLERASGWRSLGRSKAFLRTRSGTGMETVFLRNGIVISFVVLGEILGQALWTYVLDINFSGQQLIDDGGSIFACAGFLLAVPLATVYRFLAYINERTRKDGWDIQIAFLALSRKTSPLTSREAA